MGPRHRPSSIVHRLVYQRSQQGDSAMQGLRFTYSAHLHGTLAANARGEFKLPCAASFVGVSVGGSNANDAKLDLGTSIDRDGILAQKDCGDSGTPNAYTISDFNGA